MTLSTKQKPENRGHSSYESPLAVRYASEEMVELYSAQFKYSTWRKLWIALAEAEKELGLSITSEQIDELKENIHSIDFDRVEQYEKELHHDVMAHIHAYGDLCPKAKGIIHLGATSCFVTDNTDTLQMVQGLTLIRNKLAVVIKQLSLFARNHAELPCLGFTHFQPAQLTTVGKRATLWIQDLQIDLEEIDYRLSKLKFLGVKGTTGTQASFLALFNGDHSKVKALDALVAKKMGFTECFPVTGQTYTRKQDMQAINSLAGLAASAHKFGTDLRLLCHLKEVEEPFGKNQIGSSAMPYKRNPMLSERVCSLSRLLLSLSENQAYTTATQWLERTLDDSANRRISIPESFLTADAILILLQQITSGLVVNKMVIQKHVEEELPFMATENVLMAGVEKGGDRQELHEKIRLHSIAAGKRVKEEGLNNDLLDRICNDNTFNLTKEELNQILNVKEFIGRAPQQVYEYLENHNL